jgi:hypothetical protein
MDFWVDGVLEKFTPTLKRSIMEKKSWWTNSTLYASNKDKNTKEKVEDWKERWEMTKAIC